MSPTKVNLYETVEVSEEQRKQLAAVIDGPGSKKRIATRNELKEFIWQHGKEWAEELTDRADSVAYGEAAVEADDDLI